jgi:hypothetical protein
MFLEFPFVTLTVDREVRRWIPDHILERTWSQLILAIELSVTSVCCVTPGPNIDMDTIWYVFDTLLAIIFVS